MVLTDFIGEKVRLDNKLVTILYVGIENGYVMFCIKIKNEYKHINSNKFLINVQYVNRSTLQGVLTFIGPNIVTANWVDKDKILVEGKYKSMNAPLVDVIIRKGESL